MRSLSYRKHVIVGAAGFALCWGIFIRAGEPAAIESETYAAAVAGTEVTLKLVSLSSPGPVDEVAVLPRPETEFDPGSTFWVELWARTTDPNVLAQVSADVIYNPALVRATNIVHTPLFNLFTSPSSIDAASGLIDDLSGSHAPALQCADQVGFSGWVRVAIMEFRADDRVITQIRSANAGSNVFFNANCGSLDQPAESFGGIQLIIGSQIPTVSTWGLIVLGTALACAGTLAVRRASARGCLE